MRDLAITRKALNTLKMKDNRLPFHPLLMQFAANLFGKTYTDLMTDYRVLVESNVKCLEWFDHDMVSVISDPFRETAAFGANVSFSGNQSPKAEHPVQSLEDVLNLINPDVYSCERTLDRLKAIDYYRQLLGDKYPIIGWIEGPLAEACDLAGVTHVLLMSMMEPDFVQRLMDKCLITAMSFAKAQIERGVTIMGVGDAICSQISTEQYAELVKPLHTELFDYIHSQGALVKLHICGDISHLLPEIALTGADIVDIDWMVSPAKTHQTLGPDVLICGNLDPVSVIQNGSAELITTKYNELRMQLPESNFILSGGCEITAATSVDNLKLLRSLSLKA